MQTGLSARDRHTVEQAVPLVQKFEKFFIVHQGLFGSVDQFKIVAERASEITAPQKNRASNMTRKIQKSHFLQSVQFHFKHLLNSGQDMHVSEFCVRDPVMDGIGMLFEILADRFGEIRLM